jgi:hypothetical protein
VCNWEFVRKGEYDPQLQGQPNTRPWALGYLLYAYARTGQIDDFSRVKAQLNELARSRYVSPMCYAMGHLGEGNLESAERSLWRCYRARDPWCGYVLIEPFLDELRTRPTFLALEDKIRFGVRPSHGLFDTVFSPERSR